VLPQTRPTSPRYRQRKLSPALDAIRAQVSWKLSLARAAAAGLLLVGVLCSLWLGERRFLPYAPTLIVYALAQLLLLWLQSAQKLPALATGAVPLFDVSAVFALHVNALGDPLAPQISAALFVLAVLMSVFALRPGVVWITAGAALACEAALHASRPDAVGPPIASGLLLIATAALANWTTRRVQAGALRLAEQEAEGAQVNELSEELVARLVHEEVQSRLEKQRSEELARANNHIAQVNAILKDQHRKLQLAQREAEKLTALLVHDMKGPLSSVLGFVELVAMQLGAKPEAQGQVKHLKTALSQGRRLLEMIESLLAIARLERGAVTARREETDVLSLLQTVVNNQAARAQQQGTLMGANAEPELVAAFDKELMQRLLENLVGNALAHTKDGDRVELSAALDAGELVLRVRNSGPQIPDEVRGNLFERFVTSAKPGRGNVGLGLYFCRLVAEAHQGTISVEDAQGWSVSFIVRVPAGLPGIAAPPPKPAPLPAPDDPKIAQA
jgi:signal transduction histidine kinase